MLVMCYAVSLAPTRTLTRLLTRTLTCTRARARARAEPEPTPELTLAMHPRFAPLPCTLAMHPLALATHPCHAPPPCTPTLTVHPQPAAHSLLPPASTRVAFMETLTLTFHPDPDH